MLSPGRLPEESLDRSKGFGLDTHGAAPGNLGVHMVGELQVEIVEPDGIASRAVGPCLDDQAGVTGNGVGPGGVIPAFSGTVVIVATGTAVVTVGIAGQLVVPVSPETNRRGATRSGVVAPEADHDLVPVLQVPQVDEVGLRSATFGVINQFEAEVAEGKNPRDIKFLLAKEIISRFHDDAAAEKAQQNFIDRFKKGKMPDEMDEFEMTATEGELGIAYILKDSGMTSSTGEAIRMIKQGAVKIDGEKITDIKLSVKSGTTRVYQVGKRKFARVSVV